MINKRLVVIAPGDDIIEKEDIFSELDSFLTKYPAMEILLESIAGKENIIKEYTKIHEIPVREFTADWKIDRYQAKIELYKRMLAKGDMLLLFSTGTRPDRDLIQEAKRQHYHGKVVRVRYALSLSDFTDAFVYACLVYYPDKELLPIYTSLLSYVYEQGFYLAFAYKDTKINDLIFRAVSNLRNEAKEIQTLYLKEAKVPKVFATKKQVL